MSAQCAARDLHTIVPGPLHWTCSKQFAVQWGDLKISRIAPLNAIIINTLGQPAQHMYFRDPCSSMCGYQKTQPPKSEITHQWNPGYPPWPFIPIDSKEKLRTQNECEERKDTGHLEEQQQVGDERHQVSCCNVVQEVLHTSMVHSEVTSNITVVKRKDQDTAITINHNEDDLKKGLTLLYSVFNYLLHIIHWYLLKHMTGSLQLLINTCINIKNSFKAMLLSFNACNHV